MPKITSRFPRKFNSPRGQRRLKCNTLQNYQCGGKCQPLKNNCKSQTLGMATTGLEWLKGVDERKARIASVNAKRKGRSQYAVDKWGNVSRKAVKENPPRKSNKKTSEKSKPKTPVEIGTRKGKKAFSFLGDIYNDATAKNIAKAKFPAPVQKYVNSLSEDQAYKLLERIDSVVKSGINYAYTQSPEGIARTVTDIFYGIVQSPPKMSDSSGSNFEKENISGTNLSNENLRESSFKQANVAGTLFGGSNLQLADLSGANAAYANFFDADLTGANFQDADLSNSRLRKSRSIMASFKGANLSGADLVVGRFQSADFRGANLEGADVRGANFYGADFRGANLNGVNFDEAGSIESAIFDSSAKPQRKSQDFSETQIQIELLRQRIQKMKEISRQYRR